jgi:photosystem II stability/assembly factor-like uncharacterized protein
MRHLSNAALCLLMCAVASAALVDDHGFRARPVPGAGPGAAPAGASRLPAEWRALGPFGGDVSVVAESTATADVVLAGVAPSGSSGGTMYRSTDGGATWTTVAGFDVSAYDVEFTPAGTAFAGTDDGVWRSTDEGVTWAELSLGIGINDTVFEIAIDPSDAAAVWAGIADHSGAQTSNVLRSTDGGATWANATPPMGSPMGCRGIAVNPSDSDHVFAAFGGAFGGGQVWRSTDGGTTWLDRSAGLPSNPMNDVVHDGATVFVGGGQRFGSQYAGVYASTTDGASWTALHDGTWPLRVATDVLLDPSDSSMILVATEGAGLNRSTDGGTTWAIGIGGTADSTLNSVRFAPADIATIYLGASSIGVVLSTDGGTTFNPSSVGIGQLEVHSVASNGLDPQELAVAFQGLNDGGVYSSTDGGQTWTLEGCPPTRYNRVRFAPGGLLHAISDGPSTVAPEALYRREANGDWTYLGPNQGTAYESQLYALRFSTNDPDLILMGGNDFGVAGWEGTVWRSTDDGQTWTKEYESVQSDEKVSDIEIVEDGTDTVMLASFYDFAATPDAGALRSNDGGQTWVKSSTGLAPDGRPYALSPSPAGIETFLLAAGWPNSGLYRTTDSGQTWIATGFSGNDLRDVACHPEDAAVVYSAQNGSPPVLRSTDGGSSFSAFDEGLGTVLPYELFYATGSPSRLLLATGTGSWARTVEQPLFADGFESGDTSVWARP